MSDQPLIIRSKKRRRTVALHVARDGQLTVQAPLHTSVRWIESFIASRAAWITQRRKELALKAAHTPTPFTQGSTLDLAGETLSLKIVQGSYAPLVRHDDFLCLSLPASLSEGEQQAEIRTELVLWAKKQARRLFQERLAFWAKRMELTPLRLVLCAPKRQWGSCTSKNEIRLNWHLIFANPDLLDYVIVHELAHIPHKNHSAAFWRHVGRFIPDWKVRRAALHAWEIPAWLEPEPQA